MASGKFGCLASTVHIPEHIEKNRVNLPRFIECTVKASEIRRMAAVLRQYHDLAPITARDCHNAATIRPIFCRISGKA
jgi:hypothetical protein